MNTLFLSISLAVVAGYANSFVWLNSLNKTDKFSYFAKAGFVLIIVNALVILSIVVQIENGQYLNAVVTTLDVIGFTYTLTKLLYLAGLVEVKEITTMPMLF